ncbi:MAG: restriction endonuclease subunit S, partial [Anaerolineales bacterium]|nr:restriction endonuclease subunit S [Anaerolineales bacterium]
MMATTKDNGQNGYSLPDGWEWSTLEDCVDILDGRRVPINSEERERRITGKDQSELFPYYGATGHVGWIDDFIFDEEIVLLGEDGAPFLEATKNKAYIVRGKSWVNNHAHVLRAKAGITTNLFLMHYLNIFDYHDYVTGTTRLKLNQGRMRVFPIPLPPLPEQERIVSRIEELFSDLEAGVAALERVRAG